MGLSEVHYFFTEFGDRRVQNWSFVGSPYALLAILFSYLYFVLRCGPRFMKNRRPYELKKFMRFYNIFQIVSNAVLVYIISNNLTLKEMTLCSARNDDTVESISLKLLETMWYLYMLKIVDLAETIIFVLRKNQHQVSFLHLYHHVSVVLVGWMCIKYIVNPATVVGPLVNSCVHVIMYTYYLLSTFDTQFRKILLKLKPMITLIQIVQFVILLLHTGQGFLPNCNIVPLPIVGVFAANLFINFLLFMNFYLRNYVKQENKKK